MAGFGLMFHVKEGGVSDPIPWKPENFTDDKSIIVLDESNQRIWLWHGSKQGLVARRTALRQAESLKGHGYTVGKSIIGRDIKEILEIDQRKIGREPNTDEINKEFQAVLAKKVKELDNFVITFSAMEADVRRISSEPTPTPAVKAVNEKLSTPTVKSESTKLPTPTVKTESAKLPTPTVKAESSKLTAPVVKVEPSPAATEAKAEAAPEAVEESPIEEARISFVFKAILDHYDDIWISKKKDGSYSVENMDGSVCQFSIKENSIKFSTNSFSGISSNVKTEIQKKYAELARLL